MASLDGLQNLESVGGLMVVEGNDVLEDMVSLTLLTTIGSNLLVFGNPALESVFGRVTIHANDLLDTLVLDALGFVQRRFQVENPNLPECLVDAIVAAIGPANIGGTIQTEYNDESAVCGP